MRERVTVADAKNQRIPEVLNVSGSDPRFYSYLNQAIERLVEGSKGKFVGAIQKYRICATHGCITWPRQIETIEAAAVCDCPIRIRNHWFEFVEHGFGLRQEKDGCATDLYDRDSACVHTDITGVNKKLKVYCDLTDDEGADILFQGYNEDGNWIQTAKGDGDYWDGEIIQPAVAGQLSTNIFTVVTGIQKPITKGVIRLYAFNTDDDTQQAIGLYEPDERNPNYRRSLVAGLSNRSSCSGTDTECAAKSVTVLAKMAFLPVYKDTDWLLINSLPAIRFMCQAIRKEENNLWDDAGKYESRALKILDDQLQNHHGDSPIIAIRMPGREIYGGGVANVI